MRGATTTVLVSWNSAASLAAALSALDPASDVIVVDNNSEDGSADLVARQYPQVRLFREGRNLGFAGAINKAAASTRGDYLLLLNPDVVAAPGAIDRLSGFLDAHENCGAVAGLLVGQDGAPQRAYAARRLPTLATWAVDLLLIDEVWPSNPVTRRYRALDVDLRAPSDVEQPAAACLMVRRSAFAAIGGMDERFYPAWFEDVDLCRRLRDGGWKIVLVPDAVFRHTGGESMRRLGVSDFNRIWYRNLQRYVAKHDGTVGLAAVKLLIVGGMLARAAASLLRRDAEAARAYVRVLSDTIR